MKNDLSVAYRNLKSPNIKTRKKALQIIKNLRKTGK
ncbi:putative metal homeostasis protein [Furfurilactobacillus sp. WILCCON 0119]